MALVKNSYTVPANGYKAITDHTMKSHVNDPVILKKAARATEMLQKMARLKAAENKTEQAG